MCAECLGYGPYSQAGYRLAGSILCGIVIASFQIRRKVIEGGGNRTSRKCVGCGYSLAGLSELTRCPECGRTDARWRVVQESVEYRFSYRWSGTAAFGSLALIILLVSYLRHVLIERTAQSTYPLTEYPYFEWQEFWNPYNVDWGVSPALLASLVIFMLHRLGGLGLFSVVLPTVLLAVAVGLHAWKSDPFGPQQINHLEANLLAYGAILFGLPMGIALDRVRARKAKT